MIHLELKFAKCISTLIMARCFSGPTLQRIQRLKMFCPICVYCPIRVWDVPYAYTHMGRPYAYGTAFCPI